MGEGVAAGERRRDLADADGRAGLERGGSRERCRRPRRRRSRPARRAPPRPRSASAWSWWALSTPAPGRRTMPARLPGSSASWAAVVPAWAVAMIGLLGDGIPAADLHAGDLAARRDPRAELEEVLAEDELERIGGGQVAVGGRPGRLGRAPEVELALDDGHLEPDLARESVQELPVGLAGLADDDRGPVPSRRSCRPRGRPVAAIVAGDVGVLDVLEGGRRAAPRSGGGRGRSRGPRAAAPSPRGRRPRARSPRR